MDFDLKSLIRIRKHMKIKRVFCVGKLNRSTTNVSTNSSYLWNTGKEPWKSVMIRLVISVRIGNWSYLGIDFIGLGCKKKLLATKAEAHNV